MEQCVGYGVFADGNGGVGRCTNVEVCRCGSTGVLAFDGASITLIGAKTTVHHNCTKGEIWNYGLQVRFLFHHSTDLSLEESRRVQ